MRKSTIITKNDEAGDYEVEIFEAKKPKSIVICAHGKGVARWDGEHFYHHLADRYPDRTFLLADQCQKYKDGYSLNSLEIMASRAQNLITLALQTYPGVPVVVVGHSMGCAVTSQLNLDGVDKVIFVAPTAGSEAEKLIARYGEKVKNGLEVKSSDGLTKMLSKAFVDSVQGKVWEEEYRKLLDRYEQVYVFESGAEEMVSSERLQHRAMPFAGYKIIEGAPHNYHGKSLDDLSVELDKLI